MPTEIQPADAANATGRPAPSLWALPPRQARFWVAASLTVVVILALRLYQLDTLQSELYGDITVVYEYVQNILNGGWPAYFDLSSGPLYHYLIIPIALLTHSNYFGLKLASVLTSLGVLTFTYLLSRDLVQDEVFALLATGIAGVSSWLLIFSRLGNSQIIVPLLTMGSLWFAVRAARRATAGEHQIANNSRWDFVASALIAALGLYAYPQSFILPGVMLITLFCLRLRGLPIRWQDLGLFLFVTFISALPFVWILSRTPDFFTGDSYITGKLESSNPFIALVNNVINASLAFHWRGDVNIRSNPLSLPHLDWISGAYFIFGVIYWFRRERRRLGLVLFLPFILLQIPSVLVLNVAVEVPSASRTLGAAPIAYIFVASGLWWLIQTLGHWQRRAGWIVGGVLSISILGLNLDRYFNQYLNHLPYQNTPVARLVREYADTLPPDTHLYLIGCCWDYGMPEPKSIQEEMAHPEKLHYIENVNELTCDQVQFFYRPAVLIWSDKNNAPAALLKDCTAWFPSQSFVSPKGLPVFRAAPLRLDLSADPRGGPPAVDDGLIYTPARLNGALIGVRHSPLDNGQAQDLFDGDPDSLIRGVRDNPLIVELRFLQLREARGLNITLGTLPHFLIKVVLTYGDRAVVTVVQDYHDLPADPTVRLDFPVNPQPLRTARVEITDFGPPYDGAYHIHMREIQIR